MIGKSGTAPCGHAGEHLTTNYVRCGQGCDDVTKSDGVPEQLELELDRVTLPLCSNCGSHQVVKWGPEFRSGGKDLWQCMSCGRSFR